MKIQTNYYKPGAILGNGIALTYYVAYNDTRYVLLNLLGLSIALQWNAPQSEKLP